MTFLAFGNGAPDLFSAIASLSSPSSEGMGLGGLLGKRSEVKRLGEYLVIAARV